MPNSRSLFTAASAQRLRRAEFMPRRHVISLKRHFRLGELAAMRHGRAGFRHGLCRGPVRPRGRPRERHPDPMRRALPVISKPSQGRELLRRFARIGKRTPSSESVHSSATPKSMDVGDGRRRKDSVKLTNTRVAALSVEDRPDAFIWDRELPGFGVRVYRTGRKVYVVRARRRGGSSKQVIIGAHVEISAERARQQARTIKDRVRRGLEPFEPLEPTVADLARRYLEAHVAVNCRPATQETFQRLIDLYILPGLGDFAATAVERHHVCTLHEGLRDKPYQANQVVRVLSKMYSLGMAWGMIPKMRNPCRSVRLYRERRRERVLTAEESRRLGRVLDEAEADGSAFPPAIAAIRLLLLTGCRKNEILNLRWNDVDSTEGRLWLRETKTGTRWVPLTPAVQWLLERVPRIEGNPWVIVGGKPGDRLRSLDAIWFRLRVRAGLEDVRIHDFRHSYASTALELGEGLMMTSKLLGHQKIATTARYAHPTRDTEKVAATMVGDSIGADLWACIEDEDDQP